jgi:AraC family transcriptional regulator
VSASIETRPYDADHSAPTTSRGGVCALVCRSCVPRQRCTSGSVDAPVASQIRTWCRCDSGEGSRTRLLQSSLGLVEDVSSPGMTVRKSPEGFSPDFQVCLPYRGLFVWHVGGDEVVSDPNQVLFVAGGESFYLSQPRSTPLSELIITPHRELLEESAGRGAALSAHPLFRNRSQRIGFELQQLRARFLHSAISTDASEAALEESMLTLLRAALNSEPRNNEPSRPTRALIRRTKEFLEANLAGPIRLADVGRAVGASPAYLTDVFRRVEGIPLHGYLTQLRLARALVELPHANDLTTLAFSLGFSSHSHFTAAFRRAFGCTPSQFRESTRASVSRITRSVRTAPISA